MRKKPRKCFNRSREVFCGSTHRQAFRALIARSVAEYGALYPDVTIHLAATSRMLDLVEEGYDLAIWYAARRIRA